MANPELNPLLREMYHAYKGYYDSIKSIVSAGTITLWAARALNIMPISPAQIVRAFLWNGIKYLRNMKRSLEYDQLMCLWKGYAYGAAAWVFNLMPPVYPQTWGTDFPDKREIYKMRWKKGVEIAKEDMLNCVYGLQAEEFVGVGRGFPLVPNGWLRKDANNVLRSAFIIAYGKTINSVLKNIWELITENETASVRNAVPSWPAE